MVVVVVEVSVAVGVVVFLLLRVFGGLGKGPTSSDRRECPKWNKLQNIEAQTGDSGVNRGA